MRLITRPFTPRSTHATPRRFAGPDISQPRTYHGFIFAGKPALIESTAFRNGTLQGAYMIIAARALGLDRGPMSGFDNAKVDAAFFPDGKWKSNFLCNLGYGDPASVKQRSPRLAFEEACRIE